MWQPNTSSRCPVRTRFGHVIIAFVKEGIDSHIRSGLPTKTLGEQLVDVLGQILQNVKNPLTVLMKWS